MQRVVAETGQVVAFALVDRVFPIDAEHLLHQRCHLVDIIGKERHYTHTQQVGHVADVLVFLAFSLQFSNERLLFFDAVLQRIEFYAHMLQGV